MEGGDGVSGHVLRMRDVRLSRGTRQILRGVTFDVPRASFIAIMGASGSGKTTVLDNVCLAPVHVQHVPAEDARRRARELLAALEVDHRAQALPRELSGGEAQRVAIARALAVDPPVLMMDEPTASLDAARREGLGTLLRRLSGENRTILVSTHDEGFAKEWATQVIYLHEGRIS